jgi:hypothetical protein
MTTPRSKIEPDTPDYSLRISRLTIDKLGIQLYDKVSAVIAELIANSFDADAENVTVSLPLSTALSTKRKDGTLDEKGYTIEIEDDGHGMTPEEAQNFYLFVGKDRREDPHRGGHSRGKHRPVMGRKGIGKLAPFGVCKKIEVISAGGDLIPGKGYHVSHFFLPLDKILSDTDQIVILDKGPLDRTYAENSGTTIRLSNFAVKTVPNRETFHRQIATRFLFVRDDFTVRIRDLIDGSEKPVTMEQVGFHPETRIDLSTRPVPLDGETTLPVKGWLAMAKQSYKNDELAGVRIYAREKFVAQTRDFEQPAGFTGEFTVRSYLVGQVEADWLDDQEDLIRSDRQGILWESEKGQALKRWGAELIRQIGGISKEPRRKKKQKLFLEKSNFVARAKERFEGHPSVEAAAIELAEKIGAFSAEDELEDPDYVNGLSEIILTVAPHMALIDAFQELSKEVDGAEPSVDQLVDLFDKTRVAELASYARIAAERVEVITKLEHIVISEPEESKFQSLLADAPWLIMPTWSVITRNQTLTTVKKLLEKHLKKTLGEEIVFATGSEDFKAKRPDFTLASIDGTLHIVEIKRSGHNFDDEDWKRFANYPVAFGEFFNKNPGIATSFPNSWKITLIADGEDLKESSSKLGYQGCLQRGEVTRTSWNDFLLSAKTSHEQFLTASRLTSRSELE